jgi:hypothetical protein
VEAPQRHLLERVEHERVQALAPVEPEREHEAVAPNGAAKALELVEERWGGAEAGGEARGGGEDAVEGAWWVEVGVASLKPLSPPSYMVLDSRPPKP